MNVVPLDFFGPKNKRWYYGVLFAASLIIVVYLLCVFLLPSLFDDSSYYLKIAYDHYFQSISTYGIIAILSFPQCQIKKVSKLFMFMSVVFIVVFSYKLYAIYELKKVWYGIRGVNVPILQSIVPENSKAYLHGVSPSYLFRCKYLSANVAVFGYKYPSEVSLEKAPITWSGTVISWYPQNIGITGHCKPIKE